MRQQRSSSETYIDEALTVSLLNFAEQSGEGEIDRLRLQKLVFLVTHDWFTKRWKGFNYSFFRYRRGPFTKDLYQTEIDLAQAGLIDCDRNWTIRLTDSGEELAAALNELWFSDDNSLFGESLRATVRDYSCFSTKDLLAKVYEMEVVPLGWRESASLAEVPIGVDLTRILEENEAVNSLDVSSEWLDTIASYVVFPLHDQEATQ